MAVPMTVNLSLTFDDTLLPRVRAVLNKLAPLTTENPGETVPDRLKRLLASAIMDCDRNLRATAAAELVPRDLAIT